MVMASIPVIDIAPYLEGSTDGRLRVAAAVNRACTEIGFFLIRGHGVEQPLIDQTCAAAASFFRLPAAEKLAIRQPSPDIARGYTPFRGETLSAGLGAAAPADLKEMIDMGPVDVPGGEYYEQPEARAFFHPNLWPARPAGFRPTMEAYYRRMNRLADDLMGLFATALDLPDGFFTDKLDRNMSALRIICYPEQETPPEPGQLRGGAHTDYGTLTILLSDRAAGGLQARHRDGYWVDITPEPGTYVVNISDIMQRWTNDRWVSTLHRVVNPPAALAAAARRHSLVFFHQPNHDAVIEVLPSCQNAASPRRYEAVTYRDHWLGKWQATRKPAV
ncbi:MAG TPA: 2-oxoglutarate and iron-dependent oxygenase domain-containing protein [Acidisoma sp.]|uniref:isopenicillin N synthase family dioxygenase n=1 Tax=Acidisoma sp. TaxID=1872115 RepID=UPI002C41805A|nr:2-oxoglutarate and iron-dependent oxygenase domain-containing protein [Acidisoma sp.]HTI00479.1 2-oxoglutarate and iron-dependent oxygenase domain-containing protein [Acidisoma sp.]